MKIKPANAYMITSIIFLIVASISILYSNIYALIVSLSGTIFGVIMASHYELSEMIKDSHSKVEQNR